MSVFLDTNTAIYFVEQPAGWGVKVPLDSLHLAAAVEYGCARFLTNDAPLQKFPDITVELIT